MDHDKTPEGMFNKMMEEQQRIANTTTQPIAPQVPAGQPGNPPILDAEQQRVLNELNTQPKVAVTGSHPSQVASALPKCPDCGMLHPPSPDGKRCDNAPIETGAANVIDLDMTINRYLVNLKNIAVSQIQSKGIKDVNKLLQHLTIEMTKMMEGYHE